MAVREIPVSYEYTCDGCGATSVSATKGRPKYWCDLTVAQDAYDYSGSAVADGTVRKLLCDECRSVGVKALNNAIEQRRSALSDANAAERGGEHGNDHAQSTGP